MLQRLESSDDYIIVVTCMYTMELVNERSTLMESKIIKEAKEIHRQ